MVKKPSTYGIWKGYTRVRSLWGAFVWSTSYLSSPFSPLMLSLLLSLLVLLLLLLLLLRPSFRCSER